MQTNDKLKIKNFLNKLDNGYSLCCFDIKVNITIKENKEENQKWDECELLNYEIEKLIKKDSQKYIDEIQKLTKKQMMQINDFNILKVAYRPNLSDEGEEAIKKLIEPSMLDPDTSEIRVDDPVNQYHIETILTELSNKLGSKDLEMITFLKENDIQYIEI